MSSSLLLMEPMGGSFGRFLQLVVPLGANERSASRGDYGVTMRLLLSQDILIPVLVEALSLLLGPLNANVEEALMLKPGCVIQRFLLSIFLSPGGELLVVVRLPTVSFRWLGAIQNYHPLPYQMNGFGKV
ncbi:hypothetical protein CK203_029178 [Vitis vinifera]|uniref:Uncharacterized protein n=1 Tax=Vitis vinifera TaxID=29760 RepID=A0A438ISU6_VITVI|nr:hypothetical protein CK203_029178 [Vitis vinifera]